MNLETKQRHILALQEHLSAKIKLTEDGLKSLKESRDGETKSTAGDKHETGRALVQTEMDNLQRQLNTQLSQHTILKEIPTNKIHIKIGYGSLVRFNNMNYLIATGMGSIRSLGVPKFFAISIEAPIFMALNGKKIGDDIVFNGMKHSIESIC
ncbi:MAG: transcription elongation GreA/GreB family factor [Patiriisocius sp.]|jgi:transcription elongation GreA/GreB family factor